MALERAAGEIYGLLATRFPEDEALRALWQAMAADEREHAHKLATWRALVAAVPAEHRPTASGFADAVRALETVMRGARAQAMRCHTADEAFAIALELETSELDALYMTLLQSSPIARFPDNAENVHHENGDHHAPLLRMVRERSRDEHNRLRAALLFVSDAAAGPPSHPRTTTPSE